MAVNPVHIKRLLNAKRDAFSQFNRTKTELFRAYRQEWDRFSGLTLAQQQQRLGAVAEAGARPLEAGGVMPFFATEAGGCAPWENREESLDWVRAQLAGVTTFAVDGSQIVLGKDLSIPVALVQIGWFENPHSHEQPYTKDVRLDMLTPAELGPNPAQPVERRVNLRRFQMEAQRLVEYIEAHAGDPRCLVFFDGALVVTFAQPFDPDSQAAYINAMVDLLDASERCQVPLIGYVDTTYAHDLTTMLHHGCNLPAAGGLHDAQLLATALDWGDRSGVFRCDRGGILTEYGPHQDGVGFVYLKTTRQGYPVRLEFPLWMWESGQMTTYLNWVRGEVIIGGGYPYSIETADQTAVLQSQDRYTFLRILQDWAEQEQLNLRLSRKMVSKQRRR